MDMLFNITKLMEKESLDGLITFIQEDVNVPFAEFTLLAVFVVSFIGFKRRYETLVSLIPSIFITFVLSFIFWLKDWVAKYYPLGLGVGLAFSILFFYLSDNN